MNRKPTSSSSRRSLDEVEHGRLDRHVEGGGHLVRHHVSSAARRVPGPGHALSLAAGELMRVDVGVPASSCTSSSKRATSSEPRVRCRRAALRDDVADRESGFEGCEWVLEHHVHRSPGPVLTDDVVPVHLHRAPTSGAPALLPPWPMWTCLTPTRRRRPTIAPGRLTTHMLHDGSVSPTGSVPDADALELQVRSWRCLPRGEQLAVSAIISTGCQHASRCSCSASHLDRDGSLLRALSRGAWTSRRECAAGQRPHGAAEGVRRSPGSGTSLSVSSAGVDARSARV